MSREFDDEINRAGDGRGRSRSRKNEYGSAGEASNGRRRASREPDSYDEDYYLDDEPQGGGYEEPNQDRDNNRRTAEEYRTGNRRMPEGSRMAGESGDKNPARYGNGGAAGENGSRNAGMPGNGNGGAAGENGSRNAGMPGNGNGRAARENGSRSAGMPGNGNGRAAGENGSRNAGMPGNGNGRAARENGSRSAGMTGNGNGRTAGENGSRGAGTAGRARTSTQASQNSQYSQNGQNRSGSRSAAQAAKKKKIRRIIITAVAEVLTLFCIFSYAYVLRLDSSIRRPGKLDKAAVENQNLTPAQKQHMTGYKTIAVFGVDSRDGNVHKGTNADVIMLCNINRDTGEIRLISVYRDTYLNISDKNTYNKINSAYSNGGAEQTLAALNKNLDLDIHDYVTFNWKAVADGINMLGGVDDINITKAEYRYINSFITETVQKTDVPSFQLKSAGVQHLDGVQAVAYGRLRLMDTDYARTERQRIIIQKAFDKAKKADIGLLNRILMMEVEQIETSLSFSDFTDLIMDIGKYYIGESSGFPMTLGAQKMGKKGDCVIPQTLESNVAELHNFLYGKGDYQPSDMVKKISAKIAADSGMYKTGANVDSHIPADKPEETKETEKSTAKETYESGESIVTSEGETVTETDEDGNPIQTTKPGETVDGTKTTKPGETLDGTGTKPTKPGETTGGETKPTKPGETDAEDTKPLTPGESHSPTGPGETTADSLKPSSPGETDTTKPGSTKPDSTKPDSTKPDSTKPDSTKPDSTKPDSSAPSDNTTGPGVTPGPTVEPSSASEPTSAGPTGPGGSGSSNGVTPGGDDNILSEGPPGAA